MLTCPSGTEAAGQEDPSFQPNAAEMFGTPIWSEPNQYGSMKTDDAEQEVVKIIAKISST